MAKIKIQTGLILFLTVATVACTRQSQRNGLAEKKASQEAQPITVASPTATVGTALPAPINKTEELSGVSESRTLCGTAVGPAAVDTSGNRAVRFATFNMYGAFSTNLVSMRARLTETASALVQSQADVIGIQEAEEMSPEGNTIAALAERMALITSQTWYWCFFRSNPHVPFEKDTDPGGGGPLSKALAVIDSNTQKLGQLSWTMGDAILSRLPFGSTGARRISGRVSTEEALCQTDQCRTWARGESRIVIRAEILLSGRSFHFFNSHFYTQITAESPKSQVRQANEILSYVNDVVRQKKAPVAVTCDCNSPEDGAVRGEFIKYNFVDTWRAVHPALPGFTGGQNINSSSSTATSRIDYIFTKELSAAEATLFPAAAKANPSLPELLWPSDHLGVVAGPF